MPSGFNFPLCEIIMYYLSPPFPQINLPPSLRNGKKSVWFSVLAFDIKNRDFELCRPGLKFQFCSLWVETLGKAFYLSKPLFISMENADCSSNYNINLNIKQK